MAAAGLTRSVQCVTGAQLTAGARDRVQVCTGGAGLARGGRRRAPERGPAAAAGTWNAIPGTKASTTREETGARRRSRRLERKGGGGAAGGRPWRSGRQPLAREPAPESTCPQARGSPGLEVLVLHPSKDPLHLGQEAPVIVEQGALLPDVGDHPLQGRPREAGDEERHLQGIAAEQGLVHQHVGSRLHDELREPIGIAVKRLGEGNRVPPPPCPGPEGQGQEGLNQLHSAVHRTALA